VESDEDAKWREEQLQLQALSDSQRTALTNRLEAAGWEEQFDMKEQTVRHRTPQHAMQTSSRN
jgi:hypothetical protein